MSEQPTAADRIEALEQVFAALVRRLDKRALNRPEFMNDIALIARALSGTTQTGKAQAAIDLHRRLQG